MTKPPSETGQAPQVTDPHARSTWAELFFDLVLVFAVTQTAHLLAHHPSWVSLGQTLLVLGPLWWAWVGVTLLVNAVEETHAQRLLLFTCGAFTLAMAVAAPHALDTSRGAAAVFAGAYLILRLVLGKAMHRKHAFDQLLNPYTVSIATAALMMVGAALPPGPRQALWALAVVSELATPALLGRRLHGMAFGVLHLPERFGLFIIIALGETVVDAGARTAQAPLTPVVLVALTLAFAIGAALWWMYFNFAASAVEHSLRTHHIPALVVRDVLSYGHLALVLGLIMTAVGLGEALADPTATVHGMAAVLLPAGTALFTFTFGYTRWRMFGAPSVTRVTAGLLLSTLAALAPLLPGLALLTASVGILITVNIWEHWIISTGRSVPLLSRTV
jgi:low temperature requirement protein LtrA